MKNTFFLFLSGVLVWFLSTIWLVRADTPDIAVSGMLECYYTSTGIVFSVSASGTGTFENFMNTGSFQSEPDGSCKGNLSQIIGTVRDGVYFVAIENADNALNSSSSVGWPYSVDSEGPIGALMLSTNEHIPVNASGAYVPSEYTFYLDSRSNDQGSICIPIKLWDRLSGVHQVYVPNFSWVVVSMYASDRCDGIPLEDNFSADYWFQIPSRTNSIASIPLEGGERNAIYSLKISWANPRTILGMTAYPNLFYSKSFSLEKIKIIDFAGNESPITLLDY